MSFCPHCQRSLAGVDRGWPETAVYVLCPDCDQLVAAVASAPPQ